VSVSHRDDAARLSALLAQCEASPADPVPQREIGDSLAASLGGELALRWRIAVVRSAMAHDGDTVRELYGELVDRYRDDKVALAIVKPLGDEIRRLEAEGELPRTLVARSDRRKR
jgi:hypothetical protein